MTMACKICSHPNRLEIDREIVKGGNISQIAQRFDVPYFSLHHHSREHISRQLAQVYEKREMQSSMDMLSEIDSIIKHAKDIFKRNYDKGADITALKALDSQRSTLELLCKISAYLHQTKLLELQQQQSEEHEQSNAEFSEKLSVLTAPELEMLIKLQDKITKQSSDIIIPEGTGSLMAYKEFSEVSNINYYPKKENPAKTSIGGIKRTKFTESLITKDLPRAIQPTPIEFTPWEEHELNPRFQLKQSKRV